MSEKEVKPSDYRRRAAEMRRVAADMSDPDSRAIVQAMADDYQRLADFLERGSQPPASQLPTSGHSGNRSPPA